VTVLLVNQNISKAVEISDYLYMLEMGQVRHEGPRQAFAEQLRTLIRDALLGV
jgi:ABC-type branched-subunit amino acid transport system ATPase component